VAAYNTFTYNTHRYNTDIFYLALSEAITSTSDDTEDTLFELVEFVFLNELTDFSVTNHVLSETIRLADWLQIERNPVDNEWYS